MVKDLEYSELFWNATEITLQLILRIFLWFDFMWIIMSVNVEHFVSENWCDCSIVVLNRVCSCVLLKMLLILKEVSYARCFMLFYLKMYFGIFVFFSCDASWIFCSQSSVSRDPSEIILIWWVGSQENLSKALLLLLSMLKQLCYLIFFCGNQNLKTVQTGYTNIISLCTIS